VAKSYLFLPIAAAVSVVAVVVHTAVFKVTDFKDLTLNLIPVDDYTIKETCVETTVPVMGRYTIQLVVGFNVKIFDKEHCLQHNARHVGDWNRLGFFGCQNQGLIWKCSKPMGQYLPVPDAIAEAVKKSPL
jgi:hypothetical protein